MDSQPRKPKLGLALSGAAARSAFYLGFIEVIQEQGIEVDVIAAQSGASLVAASYACGTLEHLKRDLLAINWQALRQILRPAWGKGGLYSLAPAEEHFRQFYTKGRKFHELQTKLCFAATNLDTGELVPLAMGDIAHAIRITCAVPGLFTPIRWGNQYLVDGGIVSFIPAQMARQAGADIVVGVSVRATKHIFLPGQIRMRRWYNKARDSVRSGALARAVVWGNTVLATPERELVEELGLPDTNFEYPKNIFSVINRSLDLAAQASQKTRNDGPSFGCDLFITEGVGDFGDSVVISKMEKLYKSGRQSAEQHMPRIVELIRAQESSNI